MSEHEFRAAATDTLRAEREVVDAIAEILRDTIKAALKRDDQNKDKPPIDRNPKVEIYSGPNKIHPARKGAKLTKDMVDNLTKSLAQNKQGSMRIFVEIDGKREKIFHQTQGEIKTDTLDLQGEFKKQFGQVQESAPNQSKAQVSETSVEQSQASTASQDSEQSLSQDVDFSRGQIPQDLGIPELQGVDPAKVIEIDKDLAVSWNYALSDVNRVNESRQSIGADGASYQEAEAVERIVQARDSIQQQIQVNGFSNAQLKGLPLENEVVEHSQNQAVEHNQSEPQGASLNESPIAKEASGQIDVDAVLDAVEKAPEAKPTGDYSQSSDIPSLDHANEQTPAMTQEPELPKTEVVSDSQPDHLKFPTETQNQVQPLDPAMQAARAEFDRRLVQLEKSMNQMQSQVETFSQKFAPLINDPNLQSWAKSGTQRHQQAMEPVKQKIEFLKDRFKQVGQKLDSIGQGVVNRVAEAQAKAIDWGVTKLVNSRYGQENDRGGRIFEGEKHTFRKIGNNTIISRNSDKAEVYRNGAYTQKANRVDKGAIAALPEKVKKLAQNMNQPQTESKSLARSR